MPTNNATARVGNLVFAPDFSDPFVDVDKSMNTVEKQTITDKYYVQAFGRKPDKITIEGVIWETQLDNADQMAERDEIPVRTERWTGMAIPETVTTTYRRESDGKYGAWIYDISIDLIELQKTIPEDIRSLFLSGYNQADTPKRVSNEDTLRYPNAQTYGVVTDDGDGDDDDEDDDEHDLAGQPFDNYTTDDLIK